MKKFIIKFLPVIILYVGTVSFALYGTAIRQKKLYKEYNGMRGTVTSFSTSMSGMYLCKIVLDNGLCGYVNNGYDAVKVGDTWYNRMLYSPLTGITGTACSIVPNENRCLLESILLAFFVVMPIGGYILHRIYKIIKSWIISH